MMKVYPHYMTELSRELRNRQTCAEKLLWSYLRGRKLGGLKFRRQHKIGRYVVDFYCAELKLIIELEGSVHEITSHREYDITRFDELIGRGYKVMRIRNEEVEDDIEKVVGKILEMSTHTM